jgi:hypothetical protein
MQNGTMCLAFQMNSSGFSVNYMDNLLVKARKLGFGPRTEIVKNETNHLD